MRDNQSTSYTAQRLRSAGLTNFSTGYSLKEVASKRRISEASCDSDKCRAGKTKSIIKEVSQSKTYCPDCGHALFWQTKVMETTI